MAAWVQTFVGVVAPLVLLAVGRGVRRWVHSLRRGQAAVALLLADWLDESEDHYADLFQANHDDIAELQRAAGLPVRPLYDPRKRRKVARRVAVLKAFKLNTPADAEFIAAAAEGAA
jgi:hypothetical protein